MTTIRVADDGGDEMTLCSYHGYNYPVFPSDIIRNIPYVDIRSNDIILITYPKSGTNWVYELTRLMLMGKVEDDKTSRGFMEMKPEDDYRDLPSPRILTTHLPFRYLPEGVKVKKPKIILVIRNLKDVLVSYYVFMKKVPMYYGYTGEWSNYLKPATEGKFAYGSWFDYVRDWEEVKKTTNIPILPLSFEDIKEDTARELVKLRDFLGVERSYEFVQEVSDHCNFANMKKIKENSHIFYRKGEVGDWKNWFTVAQNEWFDQLYQEKMRDYDVKIRFTL